MGRPQIAGWPMSGPSIAGRGSSPAGLRLRYNQSLILTVSQRAKRSVTRFWLSFSFSACSIFVHELGHFLMARRIGVRVLTFSLGFGPKLSTFTRGDTEYCISAIPLGGYVKMAGENPEDARTGAPTSSCRKRSGSGSRSW